MDIGEGLFALIFLLITAISFVRRNKEKRDVEQRNQEPSWTAEDIPEETRRMLFGETDVRTAKPAKTAAPVRTAKPAGPAQQPRENPDPFLEVRDIFRELQRQVEMKTAKPREGSPRPAKRVAPPPVPRPQRQQHPLQPQFGPARPQQTPRTVAPPRHAPPPQEQRMVQQQSESARAQQVPPQRQQPAPMARRQQQPPPLVAARDEREGPRMPMPTQPKHKQRVRTSRPHGRLLADFDDIRRGIILSEVLGPPRALRDY